MIMKNLTENFKQAIRDAISEFRGNNGGNVFVNNARFEYRGEIYRIEERKEGIYRILYLPYAGAYSFYVLFEEIGV